MVPSFKPQRQKKRQRPMSKYKVHYNNHSSLRNVIGHSFGVLKEKWHMIEEGAKSQASKTKEKYC
jgi:hypothetical protein